ncbi:hypothetical protein J7K43_01525, partial [Candidatus Calescamantes bacterium]|nr:hypothetical protein [Candidatus Calescamantes bacterium]
VSLDWEPSLGEKEIIVSVDPENTLNEWEEDNNSASQRLWVRNLPDLQIDQTDITFSPLFPLGDEEFQIICTIHNRGESSSENVVVAFYYLQNNQPVEIGRTTISRISLGEEKQTQITAVLPYGSYEILVKIDPENSIQESNGENNSATKMLTMTSPMPTLLPDLVVMSEEISFKPESPHDQTNIQLTGKIHNLGGRYAYNVKVSFFDGSPYEEGQEVATVTIHEIPPNGEVPVSAEFNLSAGDHNVFLFADYEDNIIENNEKNNFGIIYIPVRQYVPLPDFVFLDYYALDPDPPLQNHEGKIYIKVKNIGFEPGENVKVWCYGYGWNPNTYQEDDFWVEKVVDKILPGEEKLVEFNYTPHLVTSYQIVCEVNYDYSIEEIQYDNNWYGFSIDVWPESPDLYIREGSLSYNITCTGDLVIHANIENRGNQDVYSVKVEFREESEHGELLGSRIIQVIPARSSKSTSLSLSLSEHKNLRTVYVEVDPDNEINESDEENNSYSISFPGVNLTCLYLTWQWIEGRRVKFSTSIKNYGYFPAAGFSVKFYRGEKFPELIGEEYIELLNPNGTTQAAIEWEVPDGEHVITVIVDADEEINESNEDDNKRACRIDINKPEIYVKSLTFEPEVGEVGEEMIIKVVVRNRGFASATLTRARLHVSLSNTSGCWDSYQEKENLNIELSPDEECTIEFLFTPETWGMGYVYVSIDFHPIDIYEGAYGQRDLVVAYYPPELPADFLVREEGINISDEFPIKGEFLFFYGTIYNPGKDALPPTVAQLFLGGHENGGTQIGEDVEIPSIPAYGSYTVEIPIGTLPVGTHHLYFRVDPYNQVEEGDETNNQVWVPVIVEEEKPHYIEESIEKGKNWLLSQQLEDGTWGEPCKFDVTALIVLALLHAGVDPSNPKLAKSIQFLKEHKWSYTYGASLFLNVALYLPKEASDWEKINEAVQWILDSQNRDGGFSYYPDYRSDNSNSQFALLGLLAAQQQGIEISKEVIEKAEIWFLKNQDYDRSGGWGYYRDYYWAPSTYGSMTAAGIMGLKIGGQTFVNQPLINGFEWLKTHFTVSENPCWLKQYHYYYLYSLERACGVPPSQQYIGTHLWYREGVEYLVSQQYPDGHWESSCEAWRGWDEVEDYITTAYALLFLTKALPVAPNLTETSEDIILPDTPLRDGESITFTVRVRNTGILEARNVKVIVSAQENLDTGIPIQEFTVSRVPSLGEKTFEITWTAVKGIKYLSIWADPDNEIEETNENDNFGYKEIQMVSLPDLTLSQDDIQFLPESPLEGESVKIQLTIHNKGGSDAENVKVRVYHGEPSNNQLIGENTLSSIPS